LHKKSKKKNKEPASAARSSTKVRVCVTGSDPPTKKERGASALPETGRGGKKEEGVDALTAGVYRTIITAAIGSDLKKQRRGKRGDPI